jgi:hypothetical protein
MIPRIRLGSHRWTTATLTLMVAAAAGLARADTPEGTLVEAESVEGASVYANVIDLAEASGGQAVTSTEDWHPLFRYKLEPGSLPERVTIHVRRQHGPVQLKARVDGKTKELKWDWGKPGELQWTRLGTYRLAELGDRIEIIRGQGKPAPIVDAVVFADADGGATQTPTPPTNANTPQNAGDVGITGGAASGAAGLPPERPDPALAPVPVAFSVDWSKNQGAITARHWGVAAYSLVEAKQAQEPGFVAFLATLQPGLVRVHHAGMPDKWSDEATRSWDVEAIRHSLAPMAQLPDAELMVTLCGWPTWFSESKAVAPEKYDEAEQLVRQWVRAVREASPVPVTHFEIFNEFDNTWEKAGRADELWPLFIRMVEAARDEASDAKVGGPALTWAKPAWVRGVLDAGGGQIDFLSWHGYAGGKPTTPNDQVLARVNAFADQAAFVKQELAARGLGRVETFLNEYNVQWTWQPYERRHANAIGAALQASIIARLALQDITGLAVWHAKGNAYGLIDQDNRLRVPGQLFLLGRHHATGQIAAVRGLDDPTPLDVLPVSDDRARRTVMLVNRGEAAMTLPDAATLLGRAEPGDDSIVATLHRLDAEGWTTLPTSHPAAATLPGWSVSFITEHPAPGRFGTVALPGQHQRFDF